MDFSITPSSSKIARLRDIEFTSPPRDVIGGGVSGLVNIQA